jgi:hypothetical protein
MHDRAGREGGLMAAATALIALKPPAIDKPMLFPLATRTPEPIGPASLLQSSYCYAEAQGLHIAPRCRRAAGTQAGRGLPGNGWHYASWPAWYMRTYLYAQSALRGASWVIKSDYGKPNRNISTVIRSWDIAAVLAAKGAASNNGASSRPLQPQLHY